MGRAHAPGDRAALEEALGPDLKRALGEACASTGVPLGTWHQHAQTARYWEWVAWSRLVELYKARGESTRSAQLEAAGELDLDPETMKSRAQRW